MPKPRPIPVVEHHMNVRLKLAILASGQTQRKVARAADLDETRLSDIVRGRVVATSDEQRSLGAVLRTPASRLFAAPRRRPSTSTAA
jgi:hypothetical protein